MRGLRGGAEPRLVLNPAAGGDTMRPRSGSRLGERAVNLEKLNKVCFTICILCIIVGTALALVMIWQDAWEDKTIWKCWLTVATFFAAGALTLSISKSFAWRRKEED